MVPEVRRRIARALANPSGALRATIEGVLLPNTRPYQRNATHSRGLGHILVRNMTIFLFRTACAQLLTIVSVSRQTLTPYNERFHGAYAGRGVGRALSGATWISRGRCLPQRTLSKISRQGCVMVPAARRRPRGSCRPCPGDSPQGFSLDCLFP